jgi:hypothetical protein
MARPARGPKTTPEIQVLLFEDESGLSGCSVDCGILKLDEEPLVEVVAMLEDVCAEDVVARDAFSMTMVGQKLEFLLLD